MRDRYPASCHSLWPAHPATVFWTHPQLTHPPIRHRTHRMGLGRWSYWSAVGILLTIVLVQSVAPMQEQAAVRSDDPDRIVMLTPGTAN